MLRVVFLPNFNVTNGQRIYPAADLSEQISTAGKEASGTGNMKFSMNGALTIGTLDGANVELRTEVGADNFFLFGLDASEVEELRRSGYRPSDWYRRNTELATVVDLIRGGFFSRGDPELFEPLMRGLIDYDPYFVFADFAAYVDCQAARRRRLSRPRALDADVDLERGAHGQVLVGSHDPRVLPRHLARAAGADQADVAERDQPRFRRDVRGAPVRRRVRCLAPSRSSGSAQRTCPPGDAKTPSLGLGGAHPCAPTPPGNTCAARSRSYEKKRDGCRWVVSRGSARARAPGPRETHALRARS